MARQRRSKEEVIAEKISVIEGKLSEFQAKIDTLNEEKASLQKELTDIEDAKKKAEEEEATKQLLKTMKKKGLTVEDVKAIIENK